MSQQKLSNCFEIKKLDGRSYYLRRLVIEALVNGGRGHFGPSMSLIEICRVLYDSYLNFHPDDPHWPDRDRLILSKGHGCLALYAILADKGFFFRDELTRFCKFDSLLGGHPELGIPGIEASTGSLGHGLSIGIGMALAARMKKKKYRVVVITGDGEINEGSIWEGALSAAKHRLSNLTVIIDYNKIQCYGPTQDVVNLEPLNQKWQSFGFKVIEADGHDIFELNDVLKKLPLNPDHPTAIICHTVKGKGFDFAENNPSWHYKHEISKEEIDDMYKCIDKNLNAIDCNIQNDLNLTLK